MPDQLLQVAAVIAAGIVSKPNIDLDEPDEIAKKVVNLAKALIKEASKG